MILFLNGATFVLSCVRALLGQTAVVWTSLILKGLFLWLFILVNNYSAIGLILVSIVLLLYKTIGDGKIKDLDDWKIRRYCIFAVFAAIYISVGTWTTSQSSDPLGIILIFGNLCFLAHIRWANEKERLSKFLLAAFSICWFIFNVSMFFMRGAETRGAAASAAVSAIFALASAIFKIDLRNIIINQFKKRFQK